MTCIDCFDCSANLEANALRTINTALLVAKKKGVVRIGDEFSAKS